MLVLVMEMVRVCRALSIRPSQLAGILIAANQSAWAPEFFGQPAELAGIGGTMHGVARYAHGMGQIKTRNLKGECRGDMLGLLPDAGKMCAVVAIVNHPLAKRCASKADYGAMIDWVFRRPNEPAMWRASWFIEQMKM
jgi:hypothetical protein